MSNISKDKEHFGNMSKMEVARLKKSLRNYFRKVNVSIFEYIPALIMGLMLFQLTIGFQRLSSDEVGWMFDSPWGDAWLHYLGWITFRQSAWTLPLGINQNYGMELQNSITMTDSIPIMAILSKSFSAFLPSNFQYFGVYLLLCYLLQSFFAYKIISRLTTNKISQYAGTVLMCCQPILWHRVNVHIALVSHWLLLAFLYLCIFPKRRRILYWTILLVTAQAIHFYFFAMGLMLFLVNQMTRIYKVLKFRLAMEVILVLLLNMMTMWQLGYFKLGINNAATKFGFELQRMDLAQPLNFPGWSVLLSPISIESQGNFDGFNYLGLGSILGLMIAVLITIREKVYFKSLVRSNIGIIISAAIMAAYAITNYVSIARNTFVIPLPEAISIITDTFRGAGRFFWVTIYILCIFQVIMILRLKRKVATFLLVCIAFIQLGDTSIGWTKLREVNRSSYSSIASQVQKGDLGNVMIHTKYLRCFPVYDELPNWKTLGLIAVVYQKQTTCIRASRLNVERVEGVRREFKEAIFSDKLTPDTLYVVPNEFRPYVANSYPKNQIMFFDSMMLLLSKDVAYDKDEKIK